MPKFRNFERGYYLSPLYLKRGIRKGDNRTPGIHNTAPSSHCHPQVQLESSPGPHTPATACPQACLGHSPAQPVLQQDPQTQRLPRPCCAHSLRGRAAPPQGAEMCSPSDHQQPASEPKGCEGLRGTDSHSSPCLLQAQWQ